MAEQADAYVWGAYGTTVWVQVSLAAPKDKQKCLSFFCQSETLLCYAQRTYGAELTLCEWRSPKWVNSLGSLSRRSASRKYTPARTNRQAKCLSFFCGQQTCVVCNTTCYAPTHTVWEALIRLCKHAHFAISSLCSLQVHTGSHQQTSRNACLFLPKWDFIVLCTTHL